MLPDVHKKHKLVCYLSHVPRTEPIFYVPTFHGNWHKRDVMRIGIRGTEGRLLEQISDGVFQEIDTHGAQTSAGATTTRNPRNVFDNPVQAHIHRVEGEETFVLSVDVVPFVVGDVHLQL